jgi:hypothetical protein
MKLIDLFGQGTAALSLAPDSSSVDAAAQRLHSRQRTGFVPLRVLPKPNALWIETARVLRKTEALEWTLYAVVGLSGLATIVIAFVRACL